MLRRLVLGRNPIGTELVEAMDDDLGELYVVTDNTGWVTTLRDAGISAVEGDPTDPGRYPSAIDFVVVGDTDPELAVQIARAARDAVGTAVVFGVITPEMDSDQRAAMAANTDETMDLSAYIAKRVLDASAGSGGQTVVELLSRLRRLDGPLAVIAHDNPDPDAIASALALAYLAEYVGVHADAYYGGEISHQENRALVNLLELSITRADPTTFDPSDFGGIALVDHARAGINDFLPSETAVSFVIDHHPPRVPLSEEGRFVDVRPDIGSTSTILAEYYRRLGIEPTENLATALVYGIRTDTNDFVREVATADFEAAAFLRPYTDHDVLDQVETPSLSPDVLSVTANAIRNREVKDGVLVTGVGSLRDRDTLSQAADLLLNMEEIDTTVVYGYMDGTVYVSGRARGGTIDLGETFREAFDQIGDAGGHADMAGGQLSLGILEDIDPSSSDDLDPIVRDIVAGRFFETLQSAPTVPTYTTEQPSGFPED